ncbi:hypothetical protein D3C79_1014210 [compost metagenome]
MTPGRTIIRLLTQYDLVDQPRGLGILRWQPGQSHAGQFLLQALGQRHEVPYGKHVGFHEASQDRQRMYFREDRVLAKF